MTEQELHNKLSELLSLPGETEVVEFKEAKNDYDFNKLGKYFSALSNEANLKNKPHAWFVFGVNNNHQIVGSNYRTSRKDLDHLKYEIAEKVNNRITFIEIYELQMSQGRVVMFQIPAAPQGIPVFFGGFYYGRDGESTGALNIQEIEQIRNQANRFDWSAAICHNATTNDLDSAAIAIGRENFKKKNPRIALEVDKWDNAKFLQKAKLTINGKITAASLLLLGKPESTHFILPAFTQITWILKDKDNIELDYKHFSMPLLLNTDAVLQKIRNLNYRYLPDNTLFPTEVTQYEPYVIREALHNCIAHQDYFRKQRILVIEHPNYLLFENAGNFIPGSVEKVIDQDVPQRDYRNTFLCDTMVELNMIDTVGSGIKRMFTIQRDRSLPLPDFDTSLSDATRVKIYSREINSDFSYVLRTHKNLSLKDIVSLDKVQKRMPLRSEEVLQLRSLKLIEGNKPNYRIADMVGSPTSFGKSDLAYTEFKERLISFIKEFGKAPRADIETLFMPLMSEGLSIEKKKKKLTNMLYKFSKEDGGVHNTSGSTKYSVWVLVKDRKVGKAGNVKSNKG